MPDHVITTCSSCPAQIIWARTAATGTPMPINAEPDPDGNLVLRPGPDGPRALKRDAHLHFGATTYTSHFATCPAAAAHRRPRNRRTP